MKTLCLGEALVELISERPAAGLADATSFAPHVGGAAAVTSVFAARRGARVALASAAADDAWGGWLRDRLAAEGVDLRWLAVLEDEPTPVAFVTVDERGEAASIRYGSSTSAAAAAAGLGLPDAVASCDALLVTAATLAGAAEREATLEAREHALRLGHPVVVDADLRAADWPSPGAAASAARGLLDDAFLVCCDRDDAAAISGEQDPLRAAAGMLAGGARHVVISLGAHGALLRGEGGLRADAAGGPVGGAGAPGARAALTGVLLAALGTTGFYPSAVAAALPAAVAEHARVSERRGVAAS